MDMIKEHDIAFVDLRSTDSSLGKMQHVTQHIDTTRRRSLWRRVSCSTGRHSRAGKSINESDMTLMPDLYCGLRRPIFRTITQFVCCVAVMCWNHQLAKPTLAIPAGTAVAAGLLTWNLLGIGDTAYFDQVAEFFHF